MDEQSRTLEQIRSDVCNVVLFWFLGTGLIGLCFSLLRIAESGWMPVMSLHLGIEGVLAATTIFRHRVPYRLRAAVVVALFFAVGVGGHISFGTPYALAFFAVCGVMASVFYGNRAGVVALLSTFVAMAAVYAGFRFGFLAWPNLSTYPMLPSAWLTSAASLLITVVSPMIAISRYQQHMEKERRRAEAANAAKSDFLAMMSHELRTPMTGIMGIADILGADQLLPHQVEQISRLSRSARTLLVLLNELLDFSKIEAGKLVITPIPFSLMELVGEVEALLSPLASEKQIEFHLECQADLTDALFADAVRLRQILVNLVGNAIKFTDVGHVTLSISQRQGKGDEIILCATVRDTGIGIPPHHQAKLFQPFVQADHGIGRRHGGSGLGLSITRRLLDLMDGEINVTSREGLGSVFSLTLPVRRDREKKSTAQSVLNDLPGKTVNPLRILLAEDNETTRYLLEIMLKRWGYTVSCVCDGAAALEQIQTNDYDIVLMDVHMPGMDGITATRMLRKLGGNFEKLPVVGLTADIISDHRDDYLAAGMSAVVGKPVDWAELRAELERHCPTTLRLHSDSENSAPGSGSAGSIDVPISEASILSDVGFAQLERDLGKEHLAHLLPSFRRGVAELRGQLSVSVARGDFHAVRRSAHTLKGLCAQFGATEVRELASYIEVRARDIKEVQEVMIDMSDALDELDLNLASRCADTTESPPCPR